MHFQIDGCQTNCAGQIGEAKQGGGSAECHRGREDLVVRVDDEKNEQWARKIKASDGGAMEIRFLAEPKVAVEWAGCSF